jgi:VWFA-related protein
MNARAGAIAAVLLGGVVASAQDPPRFRAGVEAVRVDVLVVDGDRPVPGLAAGDFDLRDSGVSQRIAALSYEDEPIHVMLTLDTSGSVDGQPLAHLRQAAAAAVDMLTARDRAAVLTFSSEIDLACAWTGDRALLASALDRRTGRGATALHDAAFAALLTRDPVPGRALILLFSDGEDTASWLPGETVLEAARRTDAVIYVVGLPTRRRFAIAGFRLDLTSGIQRPPKNPSPVSLMEPFLPVLARETGGKFVDAERTSRLQEVFTSILQEFRTRYVLTYTPEGVPTDGWHPIEVKVRGKRGKVTARRGYLR